MKIMTVVGIILIVIGIIGLVYGGINYTSNKDIMDVGSMHVQVEHNNRIPLPPIAGAAALAVGLILVVVDRRRVGKGSPV